MTLDVDNAVSIIRVRRRWIIGLVCVAITFIFVAGLVFSLSLPRTPEDAVKAELSKQQQERERLELTFGEGNETTHSRYRLGKAIIRDDRALVPLTDFTNEAAVADDLPLTYNAVARRFGPFWYFDEKATAANKTQVSIKRAIADAKRQNEEVINTFSRKELIRYCEAIKQQLLQFRQPGMVPNRYRDEVTASMEDQLRRAQARLDYLGKHPKLEKALSTKSSRDRRQGSPGMFGGAPMFGGGPGSMR